MTMGILNIAPAERAGAHLLIQLYGPPRSGKTFTALRIARGMVGSKGRIGVLDTESGRARLYSDKVPGGFVVGELTPPRESVVGTLKAPLKKRVFKRAVSFDGLNLEPRTCPFVRTAERMPSETAQLLPLRRGLPPGTFRGSACPSARSVACNCIISPRAMCCCGRR